MRPDRQERSANGAQPVSHRFEHVQSTVIEWQNQKTTLSELTVFNFSFPLVCVLTGFASFSPTQDGSFQYPNLAPETKLEGSHTADVTVVPKPKKFFKSRNSVVDTELVSVAALAETPVAVTALQANASAVTLATNIEQPLPTTSKLSIKISKKSANGAPKKRKAEKAAPITPKPEKVAKAEKPPRPEKVAKVKKRTKAEDKPAKPVPDVKPTRILSRTRKAVNYSEDKSRSPSPKSSGVVAAPSLPVHVPSAPCDLETSPIHQAQFNSDGEPFTPIESQAVNPLYAVASSPSIGKNVAVDHPPIVLRISKVNMNEFARYFHHFLVHTKIHRLTQFRSRTNFTSITTASVTDVNWWRCVSVFARAHMYCGVRVRVLNVSAWRKRWRNRTNRRNRVNSV